jgi:hypothetical protein
MKALSKINFFKKKHPSQPFIYAITAGRFLGELLVFVEKDATNYNFLSLPNMNIRTIPLEKFDMGLETGVVEIVEKLPAFVHKTCLQQYKKNKTNVLALKDADD